MSNKLSNQLHKLKQIRRKKKRRTLLLRRKERRRREWRLDRRSLLRRSIRKILMTSVLIYLENMS